MIERYAKVSPEEMPCWAMDYMAMFYNPWRKHARNGMLSPAKRGLSMVFQSYALYPHITVRKNIAFPMRMAKIPPDV